MIWPEKGERLSRKKGSTKSYGKNYRFSSVEFIIPDNNSVVVEKPLKTKILLSTHREL